MKKWFRNPGLRQSLASALALSLLMASDAASARTAQDMATSLFSMLGSFADLLMGGMFLVGLGVGGMSLMKFKAHADNPQQEKLTKPIIYMIVAGGLVGYPTYVAMTSSTINGDGAAENGLTSGAYNKISD